MHCVFHGIRFKVIKIGCRDDNQFFFARIPSLHDMTTSVVPMLSIMSYTPPFQRMSTLHVLFNFYFRATNITIKHKSQNNDVIIHDLLGVNLLIVKYKLNLHNK